MSSSLISLLCIAVVGTSFLSGIFGMAGGIILVGILLVLLPVPDAMMLHGITQMASNGWRGLLWVKHVHWRSVAAYIAGSAATVLLWSLTRYIPSKPVALLLLGVTPVLVRLVLRQRRPDPECAWQGVVCGGACMTLILLTGVSGPLIDLFFLSGKWDRRDIVATKAACQVTGHGAKLLYFGALVDQVASIDPAVAALSVICSMFGTTLATKVLTAMTDQQYRVWGNRIITAIASYYVLHGSLLMLLQAGFAR
jgi:uncharacterized protein